MKNFKKPASPTYAFQNALKVNDHTVYQVSESYDKFILKVINCTVIDHTCVKPC